MAQQTGTHENIYIITGQELRLIREMAGVPRWRFCEFLARKKELEGFGGVPFASETCLRDEELRYHVRTQIVRCLEEIVGGPGKYQALLMSCRENQGETKRAGGGK